MTRFGQLTKTGTTFEQQPDAVLNQSNPVAGTLYTVLDTTRNVKIYTIGTYVVWTVQPVPLDIVITINGQTWIYRFGSPSSLGNFTLTQSVLTNVADAASQELASTLSATKLLQVPFEGRSVKVQARIGATTPGTVSKLYARVKWAKR